MFEQLIQQILAEIQRRQQAQQQSLLTQPNNAVPMLAPVSGIVDPSLAGLFDIPPRGINTGVLGATPQRDVNTSGETMPYRDMAIPTRTDNTVPYQNTYPVRDNNGIPPQHSPGNVVFPTDVVRGPRDLIIERYRRPQTSGGIFPLLGF